MVLFTLGSYYRCFVGTMNTRTLLKHWAVQVAFVITSSVCLYILFGFVLYSGLISQSLLDILTCVFMLGLFVFTNTVVLGNTMMMSGIAITKLSLNQTFWGITAAVSTLCCIIVSGIALGGYIEVLHRPFVSSMLITVGTAGIVEELLFRGVVFQALLQRFGDVVAILSTSIVFGLLHATNPGATVLGIVNVMLAGILFGVMVRSTGTLWMSMGFHVAWNLCLELFVGSVSGTEQVAGITRLNTSTIQQTYTWLVSGEFGIEQGLFTTILLSMLTIGVGKLGVYDPFVFAARMRHHLRLPQL